MANVIPTATKASFLAGEHSSAHTYNLALHQTARNPTASDGAYSATNEASGTGYTAKGVALTGWTVSTSGTKGIIDANDAVFSSVSIAFQYGCLFNDTHASDRVVCWYDFGAQSVSGANVTVQWPAAADTTAMFRLA